MLDTISAKMHDAYEALQNKDTETLNRAIAELRPATADNARVRAFVESLTQLAAPHEQEDAPLLSVVMPVFNVEPYLEHSIHSVLSSSLRDLELIIVDDASTDAGRQVIEMFAALDPRVKPIYLDNNTFGGAGVPSNIGIAAARGKYLGFVDSDDWVDQDAFRHLCRLADVHEADVVIGDFRLLDQTSREVTPAYDKHAWEGIPLNTPLNPKEYLQLFRLSPVPWRKLYRRSCVERLVLRFPEGDYFYEDNPLHWQVLTQCDRVVLTDTHISYHRMAREGQTMGADHARLASHFLHLNTVSRTLAQSGKAVPKGVWMEMLDWVYRYNWIIEKQTEPKLIRQFKTRYMQTVDISLERSGLDVAQLHKIRPNYPKRLQAYGTQRTNHQLSVVLPIFNCEEFIESTVRKLLAELTVGVEIFLVDDGSTDGSPAICERLAAQFENVHHLTQKNRGAGKARNYAIPLCSGTYTYFLDADDDVDPKALNDAIAFANKSKSDVVLFKYRISHVDENKERGPFNADQQLWDRMLASKNPEEQRSLALQLINYPWIRLCRTRFLHDHNIFFPPTPVHNDVPFHWHTLLAAEKLGLFDREVCIHRKFKTRAQITNVADARRLQIFESLRLGHSILDKYHAAPAVHDAWAKFSIELLKWAFERIPAERKEYYRERVRSYVSSLPEAAVNSASAAMRVGKKQLLSADYL